MEEKNIEIEIIANIQNQKIPFYTNSIGMVYLTQMLGNLNVPFEFKNIKSDIWFDGLALFETFERLNHQ